jgi:hypothetical protein
MLKRVLMVAAATLAIAVPAASAVEPAAPDAVVAASSVGCPSGYACVYEFGQYLGERLEFGPGFANGDWSGFALVGGANSAKNRYASKKFGIADGPPGNRDHSDCIPVGGNRPAPNWTIFYVKAGC